VVRELFYAGINNNKRLFHFKMGRRDSAVPQLRDYEPDEATWRGQFLGVFEEGGELFNTEIGEDTAIDIEDGGFRLA
jgi:hypothetical protein